MKRHFPPLLCAFREGYEASKRTISTQVRWGHYRWYQSHALAGSVGPTREDTCAHKGVDYYPKRGFCIPCNPTSPKEAHRTVFIRNDLPLMYRGIFLHYRVFWGKTKPWGIWDFTREDTTREDACAGKGMDCSDPKRKSCIPWNPTSPREAHENVFIRNDLPLMCRGIFPHCYVF